MTTTDLVLGTTRELETGAANTFRLVDNPPVPVRADAEWLWDAEGRRFLDLVCGSATTTLGHNHPAHRAAFEQAIRTGFFHTGTRLPSPFRANLYESLAALMPPALDTFHLANSGAEAIEVAIKAAQFATGRKRLIAFAGGYHGRTLGALSITDGRSIRKSFSTLENTVDLAAFPGPDATPQAVEAAVRDFEALLQKRSAEGTPVAAVVVEAIQAVRGIIEPPAAFFQGIQQAAFHAGALLILDEIWNGFGRTGDWFAFQRSRMQPDLIVMGKALSASLPLSAVAGPSAILKAWPPGMHTSTFQGNPIACAAAAATIATIRGEHLLDRVKDEIEPRLVVGLQPLRGRPLISAIRVAGAQAAVAFDRRHAALAVEAQRRALRQGILVYGGGTDGECVMLIAPLTINLTVLDEAVAQIVGIIAGLT